jgi:Putative abortive phage resistance protein AbiGi, antitoxin
MAYQTYTSNELTHFVGRRCGSDDERYQWLAAILRGEKLRAGGIAGVGEDHGMLLSVTGNKKISDETAIQGQVVCFCDIPVASLELHMRKYSRFGVAFSKSFLVTKGANPVFYVVRDAVLPGIIVVPNGSGSLEPKEGITRAELLDHIHEEAMALSAKNYDLMVGIDNPDLQRLAFRAENLRNLLYQVALAFVKPFDSTEPEESDNNYYMERE